MLIDLRGIVGGDAVVRVELPENSGAHRVEFVEVKSFALHRPLGEHSDPGAGFEDDVVRSDHREMTDKPSQIHRRREMLIRDLFFATHGLRGRSEEHTSELQSLMRISYAVFCLKKKKE